MQSAGVNIRHKRASSEVEEVLNAQSRRRIPGQLGKTHFKLAPGLLQSDDHQHQQHIEHASSEKRYNEAWEKWFKNDGITSSTLSYEEAWNRWFSTPDPHQIASTSSIRQSIQDLKIFEEVPREATRPIMSRLPLKQGEELDAIAANPTEGGSLDYLSSSNVIEAVGVHPEADVSGLVTYTRARLPVLDDESYHLWNALHRLRGISNDYAEGYEANPSKKVHSKTKTQLAPHPISDEMDETQCPAFNAPTSTASDRALALVKRIFNWSELPSLPVEDEYTWYGVAFRSKRKVGSESLNLYEADRRSHEEAVDSGGLLMYWYGSPNAVTGHNLATCIWTNRQDAIRASALPLHARAAAHAFKAYESFELNRYAIVKVKGETKLRLEEWTEEV
ncbi:hypothetical protein L7F22_053960 [Adiantum nelumboides]|nr:hypothetical protein [Adiantum nelumboides]